MNFAYYKMFAECAIEICVGMWSILLGMWESSYFRLEFYRQSHAFNSIGGGENIYCVGTFAINNFPFLAMLCFSTMWKLQFLFKMSLHNFPKIILVG